MVVIEFKESLLDDHRKFSNYIKETKPTVSALPPGPFQEATLMEAMKKQRLKKEKRYFKAI